MIEDPIVQEVRDARKRLWEECNGDLNRLIERFKAAEASSQNRLVVPARMPMSAEGQPESA